MLSQYLLFMFLPILDLSDASPGPDTNPRQASNHTVGQAVKVNSGIAQGAPSKIRPEVSAYLGIPFGQAPVGSLRFGPPVAVSASNGTINATDFGPDCPSNHIPTQEAYIGGPAGEKILVAEAQTGRPYSEDCLSINVWTKPQSGEGSKAVLFWIFGGGFSIGNTACEIYDGSVLADENDVVVVSPNYRVNIFGFSGAPNVFTNVGLLDQRLALEWVRDNIAAFGGDPNRITVFGQSAGGASTDFLDLMYPDDPIAHAFIPESGVAVGGFQVLESNNQTLQSNWYKASQNAGCGDQTAGTATVACMRNKTTDEILTAIKPIGPTAIMSGFGPVADGVTVPFDAAAQITAGNYSKLPFMTGNTDNEAGFFAVVLLAYTNLTEAEVDLIPIAAIQPLLDLVTLISFTCGAGQAAQLRQQQGVPTYRYRYYGGNYTNTYIDHIGSAYHTSELPIVFGTAAAVTDISDSPAEQVMGSWIRRAWAEFAKDPQKGPMTLGWPLYNPAAATQAQLSYGNATAPSYITAAETDALCPIVNILLTTFSLATLLSAIERSILEVVTGNGTNVLQLLQEFPEPWNATSLVNLLTALVGFNNVTV